MDIASPSYVQAVDSTLSEIICYGAVVTVHRLTSVTAAARRHHHASLFPK